MQVFLYRYGLGFKRSNPLDILYLSQKFNAMTLMC